MRARILLAAVVLFAAGGLTRAQDKPLERAEIDKRVVGVVYDAAVKGTDIFNKGSHEGCYRLYEGTLMAVAPMLDHRPKLQATVKMRLERAAKLKTAADGAFELRAALDEIQNEIAPAKGATKGTDTKGTDTKATDAKKESLWDRLGGEKAVKAVVHDFVLAAAEDKKVNFTRGKALDAKAVEHLEQMIVELISANTGGPLKYTGKDMKSVHKGMMITDDEFNALGAVLVATLKKYKVPQSDIDELVKIVESTRKDIVEKK
jgi:hemoglobin